MKVLLPSLLLVQMSLKAGRPRLLLLSLIGVLILKQARPKCLLGC